MNLPTADDVASFIELKKQLVRVMEWSNRPSVKVPQWLQFESQCYLGTEISDELKFAAHYRPATNLVKGLAVIAIPEAFYVSLLMREHRIIAIDTCPGQKHTNKKGRGLPYSDQSINSTTHIHIWTERGEGYAEPIDPAIVEVDKIIAEFCRRVNLWLNGEFAHPMQGKQLTLFQWTARN